MPALVRPSLFACALLLGALAAPLNANPLSPRALSKTERAQVSEISLLLREDALRERGVVWNSASPRQSSGLQVRFRRFQVEVRRFADERHALAFAEARSSRGPVERRGAWVLMAYGPGAPSSPRLRALADQLAPRSEAPDPTASPAPAAPQPSPAATEAQREARSGPLPSAPSPPRRIGFDQVLRQRLSGDAQSDLEVGPLAGPLGAHLSSRAKARYAALSPPDRKRFQALLAAHAESTPAQALLLKGLASGNSLEDLAWFSGQIAGKSPAWLRDNASLLGSRPLRQQFQNSCAPTLVQALRGEVDPVYALRLRQHGDVHTLEHEAPGRANKEALREQARLLRSVDVQPLRDGDPEPSSPQTVLPAEFEKLLDAGTQRAGLSYDFVPVKGGKPGSFDAERGEALAQSLDQSLGRGIPVPVIASSVGLLATKIPHAPGHAILFRARRGQGEARQYQIYDPASGKLSWVSRAQVVDGSYEVRSVAVPNMAEPGLPAGRIADYPAYQDRQGGYFIIRDGRVVRVEDFAAGR